jgi:hypothetical protein
VADVGAPHLRDRIFILAYARGQQSQRQPPPLAERRLPTVSARARGIGAVPTPPATDPGTLGPGPVTFHIDDGTQEIKARSYYSWTFDVPNRKAGCLLSGKISVLSGGEKDVAVLVMISDQFINWQNNHQAQVFFSTGRETVIPLNVAMKGSGKYVLVVSNAFSMVTAKTIQTQNVQLHCGI